MHFGSPVFGHMSQIQMSRNWAQVNCSKSRLVRFLSFYSNYISAYVVFSDRFLRDNVWPMGAERSSDQGSSHDLHPVPLLQVHGRCGSVPTSSSGNTVTTQRVPTHYPGKVRIHFGSGSERRIGLLLEG